MFRLVRKLVLWGLFVALILWVLKMPYQGRPIKDYVTEFYHAPLVQEAIRLGKAVVREQIEKVLAKQEGQTGASKPMETINSQDRKDLDKILKKESR